MPLLDQYANGVITAIGFFWNALWAFVLGYAISAAIQVFVPKKRLTNQMGDANLRSVSLAGLFGAVSSSCSFAALSAARSLFQKGAHFIATVAFMFASTNLVIELGVLIFLFLGWEYLAAELVGGILMIAISALLIRLTYPEKLINAAKKHADDAGNQDEEDFDWKKRIKSLKGWQQVGTRFAMEWQMVWREILIGFTIAGFIAVFVPNQVWQTLFMADAASGDQANMPFLVVLENALIAPFVAAATFIGSMGNIPLATVLSAGGVSFAGIMGFIYSDLMVPPLVKVNARYYGWKAALYIAAIMYASIVVTALTLHYAYAVIGIIPEGSRDIAEVSAFGINYTFFLNIAAFALGGLLLWLRYRDQHAASETSDHNDHEHGHHSGHQHHDHGSSSLWSFKNMLILAVLIALAGGLIIKAALTL
ncbi:permease [Thalassospira lucentensis]|uniref:permease n=1 Tax=Thalassospira lucentensis TaxID=168935 RepID=UPI0003B45A03|nr:permease [Thalassospira lucentensis]RCK30652.1 permease [Thalassospira lucentensis MCCC 1A00383 = DSM 14000]